MSTSGNVVRVGASRPDPTGVDVAAAIDTVRRVADAATTADGSAPLDEASLLALRHGLDDTDLWLAHDQGFAWRHEDALDLVVAPAARGAGLGSLLAEAATVGAGDLTAWSHGHHPGAAALAERLSFERVRDLWVMRRSLSSQLPADRPVPEGAEPVDVRPFEVGTDEEAFLTLNAEAFAHHPEQGGLTRAGLDERIAESWFDPAGFFLAWRGDRLVGYHWTKVHRVPEPAVGEVYVVGVAPTAQGGGLGRRLTLTGLRHLAEVGLDEVILYVEADNEPAVAVYAGLGFTHAREDTHVQYARTGTVQG